MGSKDVAYIGSCLGGVMISALAFGPNVRGFKPGRGGGFLRVIETRSTPSSQIGSKAGRSHLVIFCDM
jgi:hypothetical protein